MKYLILTLTTLSLTLSAHAQNRIGFDINTRLSNFNYSMQYQKVIKGGWLYSVGAFGGMMGFKNDSYVKHDPNDVINGMRVNSPFQPSNAPIIDTSGTYNLYNYAFGGKAIGVTAGLGYFFEFGNIHGLRLNSNMRIGYAKSRYRGSYVANSGDKKLRYNEFHHPIASISLEVYHTYRLNGRYTFYYGFKIPYFFNIQESKFKSIDHRDLFSGIEIDFSLGVTYAFGKCD